MDQINYDDYVDIRITKVSFHGEPTHWEVDINNAEDNLGGGTAPTFAEAYDIAYSIIVGGDKDSDYELNPWAKFDANAKNQ